MDELSALKADLRDIIADTAADLSIENLVWTAGCLADALLEAFEANGLEIRKKDT